MSFSFQERRRKKLEKYKNEMKVLKNRSIDEINMDYIELKTKYEHKKRILSVFVITIILSIFMNIWTNIYKFMLDVINFFYSSQGNEEELAFTVFLICVIMLVAIALIFFIALYIYLRDMKELNKKLMMIEQIRIDRKIK